MTTTIQRNDGLNVESVSKSFQKKSWLTSEIFHNKSGDYILHPVLWKEIGVKSAASAP